MMLYTVDYYDARTGRRHPQGDTDRTLPRSLAKGEVARCRNTNHDRHVKWINEHGEEISPPAWSLDAELRG